MKTASKFNYVENVKKTHLRKKQMFLLQIGQDPINFVRRQQMFFFQLHFVLMFPLQRKIICASAISFYDRKHFVFYIYVVKMRPQTLCYAVSMAFIICYDT